MTDFNCTIQELKPYIFSLPRFALLNFNCTIQELKHQIRQRTGGAGAFQLHHTGIKTQSEGSQEYAVGLFQLHHTGIKTLEEEVILARGVDFNCTIQELKRIVVGSCSIDEVHFNCTIQELKHIELAVSGDTPINFNCTIQELKPKDMADWRKAKKISIAPYRN